MNAKHMLPKQLSSGKLLISFFRLFLSPPRTWRSSSKLYGIWYLSIDKNIRLEGWIKMRYP